MSRKLKFRVWIDAIEPGFFIYPESVTFYKDGAVETNEFRGGIVQQFTGLLDKNGVEIYEGDIVEWGAKGPTEVRWISEIDGWDWTGWHPCYTYRAKIIGNIFQNQELLVN